MTFCTKCGHRNDDADAFCEECGQPLKKSSSSFTSPTPQPHASTPSVKEKPARRGRLLFGGLAVVSILTIGGGAAYYFLSPEAPSNEVFADRINHALLNNPAFTAAQARHTCLENFNYAADPVLINPYDTHTQQWLKLLVDGGLYVGPETIQENSGYFTTNHLSYKKTEAGSKATQNKKLCFADGLTVIKLESFSPPEKLGDTTISRTVAHLGFRNAQAWTQTPEAKNQMPNFFSKELKERFVLVLNKDGKWEVASPEALKQLPAPAKKMNGAPTAPANEKGFFDKIAGLFSGVFQSKPSSVIVNMNNELCKTGDFSVMSNYVTERSKPAIASLSALMSEPAKSVKLKSEIQKNCKDGKGRIEVVQETVNQDTATVVYRQEGSTETANLVKENGQWKLDIGPGK